MAFFRAASLSNSKAEDPDESLARGSRVLARNQVEAYRNSVSGDSSRATKKKSSRLIPVYLTGTPPCSDRPDLNQRVALHDVIGLVQIHRRVAVRRREDHLLAMSGRCLALGRDHGEML